jgi:hypothetical protein
MLSRLNGDYSESFEGSGNNLYRLQASFPQSRHGLSDVTTERGVMYVRPRSTLMTLVASLCEVASGGLVELSLALHQEKLCITECLSRPELCSGTMFGTESRNVFEKFDSLSRQFVFLFLVQLETLSDFCLPCNFLLLDEMQIIFLLR